MSDGLQPDTVINIVFFALLFNLGVMAVAFFAVAGIASVQGNPKIAAAFAPAATFLGLVSVVFGVLRSALVALLADLTAE